MSQKLEYEFFKVTFRNHVKQLRTLARNSTTETLLQVLRLNFNKNVKLMIVLCDVLEICFLTGCWHKYVALWILDMESGAEPRGVEACVQFSTVAWGSAAEGRPVSEEPAATCVCAWLSICRRRWELTKKPWRTVQTGLQWALHTWAQLTQNSQVVGQGLRVSRRWAHPVCATFSNGPVTCLPTAGVDALLYWSTVLGDKHPPGEEPPCTAT